MSKTLLAAALLLSTAGFAAEPELKPAQEEAKAKFDEAMEDPVKAMNEACGTKATVKSDYQNFKEADWSGMGYYGWCVPVAEKIGEMCKERPAYKKTIAKKLTALSCLFAGVKPADKKDGSNERTLRNMSFEGGVFTFHQFPEAANVGDNTKATMEKALNK